MDARIPVRLGLGETAVLFQRSQTGAKHRLADEAAVMQREQSRAADFERRCRIAYGLPDGLDQSALHCRTYD